MTSVASPLAGFGTTLCRVTAGDAGIIVAADYRLPNASGRFTYRRTPGKATASSKHPVSSGAHPPRMPNQPPSAPLIETMAEVRVGDVVTRYRRSGSGRPVVLLDAPRDVESAAADLTELLSRRFRVLVPDLPDGQVDLAAWLRDFLEALGLERAAVVVADRVGIAALNLALLDTDQDGRP